MSEGPRRVLPFVLRPETFGEDLFRVFEETDASDLHVQPGHPPMLRIEGVLTPLGDRPVTADLCRRLLVDYLLKRESDVLFRLQEGVEADFSVELPVAGTRRRFRVNAALAGRNLFITVRRLKAIEFSPSDLGLPEDFLRLVENVRAGVIFVAGPTGSGKSTTLAAVLRHLLARRPIRAITLEDPIEYEIPSGMGLISQREVGWDTRSFRDGLRAAMRQDPDVIMVGEVRDAETALALLAAAETGHLVLATAHASTADGVMERLEGFFDVRDRQAVRERLIEVWRGALAQTLVPTRWGRRVLAWEFLEVDRGARDDLWSEDRRRVRERMRWKRRRMADCLARFVAAGFLTAEIARSCVNVPDEWDDDLNSYLEDLRREGFRMEPPRILREKPPQKPCPRETVDPLDDLCCDLDF
ncbi:type IV pilus twitching motility protein PilT [Thermosulfurimonas sp. F29]|uniref:type IV pilus twitching motility protein PilT n=1 Tax=Thermosulfurimonas sp. F29 TaxID=2867247 RepID=UPI001C83E232|nr:ATPase, T2SS/T4P/T4SS family [Thermosulfurimonas sp. F29]MBX6423356.1 Flp pilus assembly complex ATPase component TadA [Thermosulfurimonas sp. F29]